MHNLAARRFNPAFQRAAFTGHKRAPTGFDNGFGHFHCGDFRAARLKLGNNLQYGASGQIYRIS